jgi:ribosomal protein L32
MRPTNTQIATAVNTLATAQITNGRILDVFADILPAGYTLTLQPGTHHGHGTCWTIQGQPGAGFSQWRPVIKGQGAQIITALTNAAWDHATESGHDGKTRAEQAAWVEAHPLPVCPECGETVLPHEAAASSHPGHHRDCC